MFEYINDIATPEWWFSVVIVGLVLNLTGYFLSKKLESWGASASRLISNKISIRNKYRQSQIEMMKSDKYYLQLAISAEFRNRIRAITYFISGFSFLIFAIVSSHAITKTEMAAINIVSLLLIFSAINEQRLAIRKMSMIYDSLSGSGVSGSQ